MREVFAKYPQVVQQSIVLKVIDPRKRTRKVNVADMLTINASRVSQMIECFDHKEKLYHSPMAIVLKPMVYGAEW